MMVKSNSISLHAMISHPSSTKFASQVKMINSMHRKNDTETFDLQGIVSL